jgi:hypothetical protein
MADRDQLFVETRTKTPLARNRHVFVMILVAAAISGAGLLLAESDNEAIATAARKYIAAHSDVSEFDVKVEKIEGDYARVGVTPKHRNEADPAWVFLKREHEVWHGLTMGTYFTAEDYDKFHIPVDIRP